MILDQSAAAQLTPHSVTMVTQ